MFKRIRGWWNSLPVEVNQKNSSLGVSCTSKGTCFYRHTALCGECGHNAGFAQEKSFFVRKGA